MTARTLAALQPGERGKVTGLGGDADAVRRLMDLGLIRGTTVEVIRRRGFMLTLRRSEAEHITVE